MPTIVLRAFLPLVFALLLPPAAAGADSPLRAADLSRDAAESRAGARPIVLAFTARYCGYCERLMQEFLIPMHISGDYETRAILRELTIDAGGSIRDLDGSEQAPSAVADRYGIGLVPTILFLDSRGNELTRRIVGLTTPELFGGYLDFAIDEARGKLQQRRSKP